MAETIDVAKLKTDAFEAIDALFSENDEAASSGKRALKKTGPTYDEFAILDEYTLALDWEYSDKELNRLIRHLDKITLNHPDKHNLSLVKIIKSIINYLQKAKEKAYPQTLNVMASVIFVLKNINTKNFDESEIKLMLNSTYNEVVRLKKEISNYNKKLRKNAAADKKVKTENASDLIPGPEKKMNKPISNETGRGIDVSILTRLDQLDEKISYLEKQNNALKKLMIDQHQSDFSTTASTVNTIMEEDTKAGSAELGQDHFSPEREPFSPSEKPVTVKVDDILLGPSPLPASNEKMFTSKTDNPEAMSSRPDGVKACEPDSKKGDAEYVRFFKIGRKVVALPDNYIQTMHRLPKNIKKQIYTMKLICLEDLSSVFQKRLQKIQGLFLGKPDPGGNKTQAAIKILGNAETNYNYAVLCSCNDTHVVVPVTGRHTKRLTLATRMNKTNSKLSKYSVKTDGMGTVPLVIPC